MIDIGNFSDNTIKGIIALIILVFIKGFLSFMELLNLDKSLFKNYKTYLYIKETIDLIINTIVFIIALFILFFGKDTSILVIILAVLFLLKGFFNYAYVFDLYKSLNLSDTCINKLEQVKMVNSLITNTVLFIASIYMLKIIFTKK
jgi:hypothetical protein